MITAITADSATKSTVYHQPISAISTTVRLSEFHGLASRKATVWPIVAPRS